MHRSDRLSNAEEGASVGIGFALRRQHVSQAPSSSEPTGGVRPLAAQTEHGVLHTVLREHIEIFLAHAQERERPVPRFVERELRAYLECGLLCYGFVRLRCVACGHDRLVAFSCKSTDFTPVC